jgi:PadR family transcriptional regulator AphA
MPRQNKTRYALLGMLSYKPMSGYEMKKMSDHSIGHFWNENFGNIYPVLKKLEAEGLVTMIREDSDGGPSRKTYTITSDGRKILTEWLAAAPDVSPLREELLLQVFFGQWTDPDLITTKIRAEDERCSTIIRELEAIRDHMDSGQEINQAPPAVRRMMKEGTPYWRHTINFGLHYYSGIRNWCAETIKEFEK